MEQDIPDQQDPTPVWDSLDVDLVIKILKNTLFSPFFLFLVPTFYYFQGIPIDSPAIIYSSIWCALVSGWLFMLWISRLYANQGSLLWRPPRLDWGEQIVLVTGGASGVGELLANTLAVRNVTVVVLDIKPIVTENSNVAFYPCDISDPQAVKDVASKIIEEIGHPTMIINNAGVVQGKRILDLTPADLSQTFGVNALSHWYILQAFLPNMIENNFGHVVTVSSVMGLVGCAQMTDYCASKASSIALHNALRAELDTHYKARNVRTSLILPGHIATPLFSTLKVPEWPWRFFFPTIPPIDVVKAIVRVLDEQHSVRVMKPAYTHFGLIDHILPSFVSAFSRHITRADHAMENFEKKSGLRKDEVVDEKKTA